MNLDAGLSFSHLLTDAWLPAISTRLGVTVTGILPQDVATSYPSVRLQRGLAEGAGDLEAWELVQLSLVTNRENDWLAQQAKGLLLDQMLLSSANQWRAWHPELAWAAHNGSGNPARTINRVFRIEPQGGNLWRDPQSKEVGVFAYVLRLYIYYQD